MRGLTQSAVKEFLNQKECQQRKTLIGVALISLYNLRFNQIED